MPYYKDSQNTLHSLTDVDVENGWESRLPYGSIKISDAEAAAIQNPEPTQEQVIASYIAALDVYYDSVAKQKNYDNRYTCALRASRPGPFHEEGCAFYDWMESCNSYGYLQMERVITGERPRPTIEQLLSELPAAPW